MIRSGIIKTKTDKGFGFISSTGETRDCFFNKEGMLSGDYDSLGLGEEVYYTLIEGKRGFIAIDVLEKKNTDLEKVIELYKTQSTKINKTKRALRVFICHSSNDKKQVRELYHNLKREGFDAWLDEEKLLPGQDWDAEIRDAISSSDAVIICLTPNSINKRGYVQKEIVFALDIADEIPEGEIFLIPVKLEKCDMPKRLKKLQWVELFNDNGYKLLLLSLQSRAASLGIDIKSI